MIDANISEDRSDEWRQAESQVSSIVEFVAALQCDYERLAELKESRDDHETDNEETGTDASRAAWAVENPDDAAELIELIESAGDCKDEDDARQRISEDPLSVEVRSGWHNVGDESDGPEEFRIVLCTGGPHVELLGDIGHYGEPERVRVLFKGWGTSGEYFTSSEQREALKVYSAEFIFS